MKRRRTFDNCSPTLGRRASANQQTPDSLTKKVLHDFRKAKSECRVSPNGDGKENTSPNSCSWNKTLDQRSFYGPQHEMNNNTFFTSITPNKYRPQSLQGKTPVRRSLSLGNSQNDCKNETTPKKSIFDSDGNNNNNNESGIDHVKPLTESGNLIPTNNNGGFQNLGNTCYMNSVLQSLLRIIPFQRELLRVRNQLRNQLHSDSLLTTMVNLMNHGGNSKIEKRVLLRKFKRAVSSSASQFHGYAQHDAHEFLRLCLDILQEDVGRVNKTMTPTDKVTCPVASNFSFKIKQEIICSNCKFITNKEEELLDLPLHLQHRENNNKPMDLQNLVDLSFKREEVEHKCEKCGRDKANVTRTITKLPRIMMMYLERYSYNQSSDVSEKLREKVQLSSFISFGHLCDGDVIMASPNEPDTRNDVIGDDVFETSVNGNNNNTEKETDKQLDFGFGDFDECNNNAAPSDVICVEDDEREEAELEQAIQLSRLQYFNDHKDIEEQPEEMTEEQQMILAMQLSMQDSFEQDDDDGQIKSNIEMNVNHNCQSNAKGDLPHSYKVVSIVSHKGGSSKFGHYVSDVRNTSDSWNCYDDEFVESIQERNVLFGRQSTAYLLFYVHKELLDLSPKER
uniref:USP domain-containing protein n=1 Tax=Ciona savignyi TaxID=51511 RepID=H2Z7G1_CIOSA